MADSSCATDEEERLTKGFLGFKIWRNGETRYAMRKTNRHVRRVIGFLLVASAIGAATGAGATPPPNA
jgi:hypothetical protein